MTEAKIQMGGSVVAVIFHDPINILLNKCRETLINCVLLYCWGDGYLLCVPCVASVWRRLAHNKGTLL